MKWFQVLLFNINNLHTFEWLKVLLSNTNSLFAHSSVVLIIANRAIGLMSREFANGEETGVQSQVESYQRLNKIVLDVALLNTQVKIKGKVMLSWEWSSAPGYTTA